MTFANASQSSLPAGSESNAIMFSGGVYVGKHTAQATSVGPSALHAVACKLQKKDPHCKQ